MTLKKLDQHGFHAVAVIIVVVVVAVVGLAGWRVATQGKAKDTMPAVQPTPLAEDSAQAAPPAAEAVSINWMQTESGWKPDRDPPACPRPVFSKTPAALEKVSGILYPGQTRGTYKPHGGFRFDSISDNKVDIAVPAAASVVKGGRYLVNGEIQYTFDFIMPCGHMYRLGHLRELTPTFQALADKFPEAMESDSRQTNVNPTVPVKEGDLIATKVGLAATGNTFFDWGVYDLLKENEASKQPAYQQQHAQDKELSWHAVCWFDLLTVADESKVRALPPGDPTNGKTSDYCT